MLIGFVLGFSHDVFGGNDPVDRLAHRRRSPSTNLRVLSHGRDALAEFCFASRRLSVAVTCL